MTASYLIIPLLESDQSKRVETITFTADNEHALLNKIYPECLVLDLQFVLALSKSKAAMEAMESGNTIDIHALCLKHQHALRATQKQNMGEAGTGLFLSPHASLDPTLDCFIYSGHYLRYDKIFSKHSDKGLQIQIGTDKILITAEGQNAGLIQHLPEKNTIPEDLIKVGVAAENLFNQTIFVTVDPKTVPELSTTLCFPLRCLTPKIPFTADATPQLLGFNYSPSYWAARKQAPLFFHPDGTPLAQQPYLFLLHTAPHHVTLAYATKKALAELCRKKYCLNENTLTYFDSISMLDTQTRFLAIRAHKHLTAPASSTTFTE